MFYVTNYNATLSANVTRATLKYIRILIEYSRPIDYSSVSMNERSRSSPLAKIRDRFSELAAVVLHELTTGHRGALAPSTTIVPFYRHLLTCANGTTTTGTAGARTRSPRVIDYSHYLAPAKFALARKTRWDSSTQRTNLNMICEGRET